MKINVSEAQSTYLALGYFRSCPVSVTAHYQMVAWRGESVRKKRKCHQIRGRRREVGEEKKKNRDVCPAQPNSLIRKQEQGGKEEENLGRHVPRSTTPLLRLIFAA